MANVLIYDEGTSAAKEYHTSVHTPDYDGRTDVVINPTMPPGIPLKYLKVVGGVVQEMEQAEKNAVDVAIAQAEHDALLVKIDKYDIDNIDLLTALVKVINVRIPGNPITKKEFVDQIKSDLGL